MKPICCFFGFHDWRLSPFRGLADPPGSYAVRCQRCGKHQFREERRP